MSDIATLLAALNAKKGVEYLTEFTALMTLVATNVENIQSALTEAVSGTSTTSRTLGTGAFTLTLTGTDTKLFKVGMSVTAASTVSAVNRMVGVVTGWDSGTRVLSFTVEGADDVSGSGIFADWTISPAGDEGPEGPAYFNINRRTAGGTLTNLEHCMAEISATVTFNLPATPSDGSRVRVKDVLRVFNLYSPVIGRNGQTIEGLAEDFTMARKGADYEFHFSNGTWRFLPQ